MRRGRGGVVSLDLSQTVSFALKLVESPCEYAAVTQHAVS